MKLESDTRVSEGDTQQSLMLMPPESSTPVYRLIARENGHFHHRVEKGELRIAESDIEKNRDFSIVLDRASRVRVIDCSFRRNTAALSGAAILTDTTDRVTLPNCSFDFNIAEMGGAIASMDTDLRIRNCTLRINVVSDRGGAIIDEKNVIDLQSFVFENNSASVSGALSLVDVDKASLFDIECSNNTSGNGGCLQTSRSTGIVIQRSVPSNNTVIEDGGGAAVVDQHSLVIQEVIWTNNFAGQRGGAISAESSNVTSQASACRSNRATSGGGVLSLDQQRNRFPPISGLQSPGSYRILIDFSEPYLRHFTIDIDVRSCRVGEFSQDNGALCLPCSGSQCNFDPNATECASCPENGDCTTNVILPKRGQWHRTPCSKHIHRCISRKACDFEAREEKSSALTQNLNDCDVDEVLDKEYSQAQCAKGYKDVLCGSCDSGYGRTQYNNCRECRDDPETAVLLVLSVAVLLFLSGFVIRSNLHRGRPQRSFVQHVSKRNNIRLRSSKKRATNTATNCQLTEMRPDRQTSAGISEMGLLVSTSGLTSNPKDPALAKERIVEIFKIMINFLQVIASAAIINANWTAWMRSLLSTADLLSSATSENLILAIDCWFGEEHDPPRSVIRSVIYLVVPVGILVFYIVLWTFVTSRLNENTWYFVKRALLSFLAVSYMSYISITKTAVNTLNCIDIHDSVHVDLDHTTRRWAMDISLTCYKGSHVILAAVIGWPVVISVSFGMPIALACALIKQRSMDSSSNPWFFEATGFLCRAYKGSFVFWGPIVMLRKSVLAILVVFSYPLGTNIQEILAVCTLMLATYTHVSCQSFKEGFAKLNTYETASLFVTQLTFASALFFNADRTSDLVRVLLTVLLSIIICGFFLFLVYKLLESADVYLRAMIEDEGVAGVQDWTMIRVLKAFISMRVSGLFQRCLYGSKPISSDTQTVPSTPV